MNSHLKSKFSLNRYLVKVRILISLISNHRTVKGCATTLSGSLQNDGFSSTLINMLAKISKYTNVIRVIISQFLHFVGTSGNELKLAVSAQSCSHFQKFFTFLLWGSMMSKCPMVILLILRRSIFSIRCQLRFPFYYEGN